MIDTKRLTAQETHLLNGLAAIQNEFLRLLPYHHTNEIRDFTIATLTAQRIILTRPGRRQMELKELKELAALCPGAKGPRASSEKSPREPKKENEG